MPTLAAIALSESNFKVIIAGSRTFSNYELLKQKMDFYLGDRADVEIVSGKARGADALGERYARDRGFPIREFAADWSIGKQAGYLRNREMALYATHCVCFWDGQSRGTEHMLNLARANKLIVRVVRY